MNLKEYIVKKLVEDFDITIEEATLFFYQIAKRQQLEKLIVNIDEFNSFDALKKYFLGGKQYEL